MSQHTRTPPPTAPAQARRSGAIPPALSHAVGTPMNTHDTTLMSAGALASQQGGLGSPARSGAFVSPSSGAGMHIPTYFEKTNRCITGLNTTGITLSVLKTQMGLANSDDPPSPHDKKATCGSAPMSPPGQDTTALVGGAAAQVQYPEHVRERLEYIERIAYHLKRDIDDFPPLQFAPGQLVGAIEELADKLEAELRRTQSEEMDKCSVNVCLHFLHGNCPRGVTCSFSHTEKSVEGYLHGWLESNIVDVPQNTDGAVLTVAEALGSEAWASLVKLLRQRSKFAKEQLRVGRRDSSEGLKLSAIGGLEEQLLRPIVSLAVRSLCKNGVRVLAPVVTNNWISSLVNLDLSKNNLGATYPRAVLKLSEALQANTTLTALNMSGNALQAAGALAVLDAVSSNPESRLEALNLSFNDIQPGAPGHVHTQAAVAFRHFSESVAGIVNHVVKLSLAGNPLGAEGGRALLRTVCEDSTAESTLAFFDLSNTGLGDSGVEAVAECLKAGTFASQLKYLNIGWNRMGVEGAVALSTAVATATAEAPLSLQTLKLTCNVGLGRKGATAVANLVKNSATLTSLDVRWTGLAEEGVSSLAEALLTNSTMREVLLQGNELEDRFCALVYERLQPRGAPPRGSILPSDCYW